MSQRGSRPAMPRLTIVLVVHREQAYVSELAGSVLEQDLDGVELLAIDDASPDHSPELLDELAERSPHVRVRHLNERLGEGGARNVALDAAEGDYVWFAHA